MNITKKGNQEEVIASYENYQKYMNMIQQPASVFAVGDSVKVIVPCLTGNGQRTTFYGFKVISARVLYVDKAKLLYSVRSIGTVGFEGFRKRFSKLRCCSKSYWFMFNTSKEKLIKE